MMRNGEAVHIDTTGIDGLIESNPKWGFSNLDLIGERKGRFLVQEWKREGEPLSDGQRILLQALAANPAFTVLIVTGNTDGGTMTVGKVWEILDGKPTLIAIGLDAFREAIRVWYSKVEREEL
jgi:hypothetical protein